MKKNWWGLVIVGALAVVMLVSGSLLTIKTITNHSFVRAYAKEDYSTGKEETLLVMNNPESYLPYYNLGDAAYKKGDYDLAVSYFTQALENNPPKDKECLIRINLALATCNTIDFKDLDTKEKRDAAIKILESAKAVLLENGFATDSGDGSDENAQKLKDDIDRMIRKLEEESSDGDSGKGNSQDTPGDGASEDMNFEDEEVNIQRQLEENRKEALKQGNEMQESMEKWSEYLKEDGESSEDYDFEAKRW